MALYLTDGFTDLVMHVLAHVRLAEAGNLFDARYVAWVDEQMPSPEVEWIHEAADALERIWAGGAPPMVHAWPELFGSIEALEAAADVELEALACDRVQAPAVLDAVRSAPGTPLLHATVCALAPWYTQWWSEELGGKREGALEQVGPWLQEAEALLPTLAEARVELAWALGSRGRAFRKRIVVGAPAPWNGQDGRTPAVLAMHEQCVRGSGQRSYVHAEWAALTGLSVTMQDASASLRAAHGRWLASLGLRPLLDALVQDGRLGAEEREHLAHDRAGRSSRLASLDGG